MLHFNIFHWFSSKRNRLRVQVFTFASNTCARPILKYSNNAQWLKCCPTLGSIHQTEFQLSRTKTSWKTKGADNSGKLTSPRHADNELNRFEKQTASFPFSFIILTWTLKELLFLLVELISAEGSSLPPSHLNFSSGLAHTKQTETHYSLRKKENRALSNVDVTYPVSFLKPTLEPVVSCDEC